MVFARLPRALHRRLRAGGAVYYPSDLPEPDLDSGPDDSPLGARFVCDWATDAGRVDALLAVLGRDQAGDGSGAPGAV
jgi:threonine aldolase